MIYFLYDIVITVAALIAVPWLALSRRHRPLLARFAPPKPPDLPPHPIWVHACSLGEAATAKPIIAALQARWPQAGVLLTVSTTTGYQWVQTHAPTLPVTWFPFDWRPAARRFLGTFQPRALLLIETEIWPNVLRETQRRKIPILLVNGRLSDKHVRRYRRFRCFFRPVLGGISCAGMQNSEYAQRLAQLGLDPDRISTTGCTKFDGAPAAINPETVRRVRAESGWGPESFVVTFGSTRPGDEALAAACWKALGQEFPNLRLVIAPRHPQRVLEAEGPFDEPCLRRSAVLKGGAPGGERILMLDTVGELILFYAASTITVIGGSFYPGVNGHNPIEPAALAVPVLFGPYMRNFMGPAGALLEAGGAVQIARPEQLGDALRTLLHDPEKRQQLGFAGQQAVRAHQGAIARNLDLLATILPELDGESLQPQDKINAS